MKPSRVASDALVLLAVTALAALAFVTCDAAAHAEPAPPAPSLVDPPAVAPIVVQPANEPRWWRLAIGTAGIFAVGEVWYWRRGEGTNSSDWSLPGNLDALGEKLSGDGFRYDGDGWATNAIKHPLFGATMYELARESRLGVGGAFLVSTGASLLWETVAEWREYASINDLLYTSPGGLGPGEAAHQLIHHARAIRGSATIGEGVHLEEGDVRAVHHVALAAEVDRARVRLAVAFDERQSRAHDFAATAVLARAGTVALVSTYDYHRTLERTDHPASTWDLVGVARTGGEASLARGPWRARFAATGDLAMLKSEAYARWRDLHPDAITLSSLHGNEHGYYYAAGASLAPAVELRSAGWRASLEGVAGLYRGIATPHRDRYRSEITRDATPVDADLHATASASYTRGHVTGRVDVTSRYRVGWLDEARGASAQHDIVFGVGYAR